MKCIQSICKKEFSVKKPFSYRHDICTAICLATAQSLCWGKEGVSLVELGVFEGAGLNFIVEVVNYLRRMCPGLVYHIYGFDSFIGLPTLVGHEDHNEIWKPYEYKSRIPYKKLAKKFKNKATLIKGDVNDTVEEFLANQLDMNYPIGFISLDLDLYSSSKVALKILEDVNPNKYLPTVPIIVDDQDYLITYNDWCGVVLAIKEFNELNKFRKIQSRKEIYQRLRCAHILDHDLRTGKKSPKMKFKIDISKFVRFNERALKI
jgi:hypothetical protein